MLLKLIFQHIEGVFTMDFGKIMWICYILLLVALQTYTTYTEAAPPNARITSVPGYNGSLPSDHYAGYIKIDETSGKYLYYYFVTSERNAATDPVVLWLNGGPGVSSFDGFIYEHGPFNFEAGENGSLPRLKLNRYSWSKVSNIIYLDSPCGVGYSYSENASDYITGDVQTASDTHHFLLKWFQEYQEFISNQFYITGESYAGIYVPTLASEVVKGIQTGIKPFLNFKGYAIGNGLVHEPRFDDNVLVPFVHGMGLISEDQYQEAFNACKGNYYDNEDVVCQSKVAVIEEMVSGLNLYDILEPCYINATQYQIPCTDLSIAHTWCNDKSVRKAIHAQTEEISGEWVMANTNIIYNKDGGSMITYHKNLTSKGYHALIYSGDHDKRVPFIGTEAWTRSLGYAIIDQWHPWIVDDQVAGYTQGYDHNLTFATIKGAGHMVPQYKPKESLAFYMRWLAGKPL